MYWLAIRQDFSPDCFMQFDTEEARDAELCLLLKWRVLGRLFKGVGNTLGEVEYTRFFRIGER